jgi:hypothetical protein
MQEIGISFPVGLGDQFVMAGAVECFSQSHDKVYIPLQERHWESVSALYADNDRVVLCPIDDIDLRRLTAARHENTSAVNFLVSPNVPAGLKILNCLERIDTSVLFPESFYHSIGLDYDVRWKFNPVPRLQHRYPVTGNLSASYIFLHEDRSRGYVIAADSLPEGFKIRQPTGQLNIFDHIPLIQGASRIDVIDSAFLHVIESMELADKDMPLFFHEYAKPAGLRRFAGDTLERIFRKPWQVYPQSSLCCINSEEDCVLEIAVLADDGVEVASGIVHSGKDFKPGREQRDLFNVRAVTLKTRKIKKKDFFITMLVVKRENQIVRIQAMPPTHIAHMRQVSVTFTPGNLWI